MSRRTDYIEIADAIRRARESHEAGEDADFGIDIAARAIAELFEKKSNAFNLTLFLSNCGCRQE